MYQEKSENPYNPGGGKLADKLLNGPLKLQTLLVGFLPNKLGKKICNLSQKN